MFLFKPRIPCLKLRSYNNLHSTMFLFKPYILIYFLGGKSIYIPLCFYLNPGTVVQAPLPGTNLHSTMFLFKHRQEKHINPEMQIYIPLCFYLNSKSTVFSLQRMSIYIPLCFYLNQPDKKSSIHPFIAIIFVDLIAKLRYFYSTSH